MNSLESAHLSPEDYFEVIDQGDSSGPVGGASYLKGTAPDRTGDAPALVHRLGR